MGIHNQFGQLGEQKAVDFLQANGYKIRERNYRYLKAEVDIIAHQGNTLVIVEVRSRSSNFHEHIAATVTKNKIRLLTSAAQQYVEENDLDVEVRFDIITIRKKADGYQLEHLKDAFFHF